MLGVDRVYQVVAGEVPQPLPKESRFGFVDDALWRARGLCHVWTAPVYGASAGMCRAETRGHRLPRSVIIAATDTTPMTPINTTPMTSINATPMTIPCFLDLRALHVFRGGDTRLRC